jgi:16S rRNA (cytidine1402-2'-O)-methyltransferase
MSSPNPQIMSSTPSQAGELLLVATPIGNLKDITLRALEVLQSADAIACEDTRVSGNLLKHYGITTTMIACHAHNEAKTSEALLARLMAGARIALICDAGTPLLSDPGARIVQAAIAAGVRVTPVPGASALLAALTVAGCSTEAFYYAGFLPSKAKARRDALQALAALPSTLVLYEAPHRLVETLEDIALVLGMRQVAVARELTKLYEECLRGTPAELCAHFEARAPRGECVLVIAGAAPDIGWSDAALDHALREAMRHLTLKEAVAQVAKQAKRPKTAVYARALALKGKA